MRYSATLATLGGVEILRRDVRGRWGTRCQAHNHTEAWDSVRVALIAAKHPADWCPSCGERWSITPRH